MPKGRKPDFVLRVKVGDFWHDCGAVWQLDDGKMSVKIAMLPTGNWDGSLLALPPRDEQ